MEYLQGRLRALLARLLPADPASVARLVGPRPDPGALRALRNSRGPPLTPEYLGRVRWRAQQALAGAAKVLGSLPQGMVAMGGAGSGDGVITMQDLGQRLGDMGDQIKQYIHRPSDEAGGSGSVERWDEGEEGGKGSPWGSSSGSDSSSRAGRHRGPAARDDLAPRSMHKLGREEEEGAPGPWGRKSPGEGRTARCWEVVEDPVAAATAAELEPPELGGALLEGGDSSDEDDDAGGIVSGSDASGFDSGGDATSGGAGSSSSSSSSSSGTWGVGRHSGGGQERDGDGGAEDSSSSECAPGCVALPLSMIAELKRTRRLALMAYSGDRSRLDRQLGPVAAQRLVQSLDNVQARLMDALAREHRLVVLREGGQALARREERMHKRKEKDAALAQALAQRQQGG